MNKERRIEWRERNYVRNYVFLVSGYVLTPGQCYASQTSEGTFFEWERYVFMFLCEKIVPVDMAYCKFDLNCTPPNWWQIHHNCWWANQFILLLEGLVQ